MKMLSGTLSYVYVNVNCRGSGASIAAVRARPQPLPALPLERIDLREHGGNILALLIEHGAPRGEHLQELDQLLPLSPGWLIQIEQLPDLRQGKAKPLTPQDQLDADPLALGIDPPFPARRGESSPSPS